MNDNRQVVFSAEEREAMIEKIEHLEIEINGLRYDLQEKEKALFECCDKMDKDKIRIKAYRDAIRLLSGHKK